MTQTLALLVLAVSFSAHAALDPLTDAEDRRQPDAPALRSAVTSKDAVLRARAALAYGRIQQPASVAPLLALAADSADSVRESAAFNLGQLGWKAEFSGARETEILLALSPLLKDSSVVVRVAAVEAVGKLALERTPEIVTPLLADPNARVRAEALLALYRFRLVMRLRDPSAPAPAALSDEALEKIKSLAMDQDPGVRRNVAYYFARVTDPRGLETVLGLLAQGDEWTRFFSVLALNRMGEPASAPAVLRATRDASATVRTAALQAAATLKIAPGPMQASAEPSVHVRAALAQALGAIQSPDAESLEELRRDPSPTVRAEALKAIARHEKANAQALLLEALKDPEWLLREAAIDASGVLEPAARESLLLLAVQDSAVQVRTLALDGLAGVESSAAYGALVSALSSDELSERGTSASALLSRKESDTAEQAWKAYGASSGQKWIETRGILIEVVAATPGAVTTGNLRAALGDPAAVVALAARNALMDRGITDLPPVPVFEPTFSPYRELEFESRPLVVFETTRGRMVIECYPEHARIHVANFVGFAKDGRYDGLPWHRVVSNFVIQGGDPDESGWGDAGWALRAEVNPVRFERGTLGMPRGADFDSGGIQVFLNHVPTPHLDGQYTVFGRVIEGLEVIDRIERGDRILRAWVIQN